MKLKTFKEFIKEDFRSSLFGKGAIIDYDDEYKINFYHEKIEKINLREYIATFDNKKAYDFLTFPVLGRPDFLRFLLFYYDNSFTIYVFHGDLLHDIFVEIVDSYAKKPISINIESFSKLYLDTYKKVYKPKEEKNKLEELKTIWCFHGAYDEGKIISYATSLYMNLLAKSGIPEKLGFDDDTWNLLS